MADRFFCPATLAFVPGMTLLMPEEESAHMLRVLRLREGDAVTVFDDSGFNYDGILLGKQGRAAEIRLDARRRAPAELPVAIHVFTAIPKGKRQDTLIEQLCELGVGDLTPLHAEHGIVRVDDDKITTWRRDVIESTKQNGRGRLMRLHPAQDVARAAQSLAGQPALLLHADPALPELLDTLTPWRASRPSVIACFIGPEGGFSPAEIARAREYGIIPVRFGVSIMRIGTAAAAVAATLRAIYNS